MWMRVDVALPRHPKVRSLGRRLGITPQAAVGALVGLWAYLLEFHDDGNLAAADWEALADVAGVSGGPALREALLGSGWLDVGDTWHDWDEYVGVLLDARRKNKERMRAARARDKADTCAARAEHVPNTCGATVRDVTNETNVVAAAGGPEKLSERFEVDAHRMAYAGFRRAAQNPASLDAELRALADGMPGHGPGYSWHLIGKALHELAVAGGPCTSKRLRIFLNDLVKRPVDDGPPIEMVTDDNGVEQPATRNPDGSWHYLTADEKRARLGIPA